MGSIHKMGMIKLSVRDYMNSLHNYIETPPTAKWNGDETHTVSAPKSISEILKLCEADPVELLIDLGFGTEELDICTKIPPRFIMTPSEAKGINTRVFLDAQKRRMETENPDLNGRFRQLEVLEQVTNAFSSLLKNVHETQNVVDTDVKKSSLTKEKRKRIRQLIWKFSRQGKLGENPSPCKNTDESTAKQDQQDLSKFSNVKVLRKKRPNPNKKNPEVSVNALLPECESDSAFPSRQESQQSAVPTLVKQYNLLEMKGRIRTLRGSKVLSETVRTSSSESNIQPPDSFEMEEVQSFEEDYPKALKQGNILEMTRTSSCQSDSSGFLEELPETLQTRHGSSDSIDSQKRDTDMENMKRACQRYRKKLIEIEQLLQEQQADCFNIITSEERESMRRLHLLRRNVLKEATELESNLDERARHVKESISLQFEEVLNEQSRLYSELEFDNVRQDCSQMEPSGNLHKIQDEPYNSVSSVPKEDPETTTDLTEESKQEHKKELSQKTDISTFIQNIKKAFRSFNNS